MPDPAFQPLTMSPEEWKRLQEDWVIDVAVCDSYEPDSRGDDMFVPCLNCQRTEGTHDFAKMFREVFAHARAGEALRRELEQVAKERDWYCARMAEANDSMDFTISAARLLSDLQAEYPMLTKEECDECKACGPVVMCFEHSFISALHRSTWTTGAIERDALKRDLASLRARLQQIEQARENLK